MLGSYQRGGSASGTGILTSPCGRTRQHARLQRASREGTVHRAILAGGLALIGRNDRLLHIVLFGKRRSLKEDGAVSGRVYIPRKERWKRKMEKRQREAQGLVKEPPPPTRDTYEGPVTLAFQGVSWVTPCQATTPPLLPDPDNPPPARTPRSERLPGRQVLSNASWSLAGPERIALVGPNGVGKTVQLLMVLGVIEPTAGSIQRIPVDMRIGYLGQNAGCRVSELTVEQELLAAIDEDTQEKEKQRADLRQRVADLLDWLGMTNLSGQRVADLSGGWQMRLALGRTLLQDPDLLLLDEPTNHLDPDTVSFLVEALQEINLPMVVASHDRGFLHAVCTKVVEVSRGTTTTHRGGFMDYIQTSDRRLANAWKKHKAYLMECNTLQARVDTLTDRGLEAQAAAKRTELKALQRRPVPPPKVDISPDFKLPSPPPKSGEEGKEDTEKEGEAKAKDEWEQSAKALSSTGHSVSEQAERKRSEQESHERAGKQSQQDRRAPQEEAARPVVIKVEDLEIAYAGTSVLSNISFTVSEGEKIAIVGPNGAGKSALVTTLVGDNPEAEVQGRIEFITESSAYFPQRLAERVASRGGSVRDILAEDCGHADLDLVLQKLKLDEQVQYQTLDTLSGGERARVAFAWFLLHPSDVLVFDEPTNHLDAVTRELLEKSLKEFQGTALVVSHDLFFLREFATRVLQVGNGSIRSFPSWKAYASEIEWNGDRLEAPFVSQDAMRQSMWSSKQMVRLRRQMTSMDLDLGVRRVSKKAKELAEKRKRKNTKQKKQPVKAIARLLEQGVDPALLGFSLQGEVKGRKAKKKNKKKMKRGNTADIVGPGQQC